MPNNDLEVGVLVGKLELLQTNQHRMIDTLEQLKSDVTVLTTTLQVKEKEASRWADPARTALISALVAMLVSVANLKSLVKGLIGMN